METTLNLLSERGFHATPMSLIAQKAGVGAGTIYRYFESKEVLINELFLKLKHELMQAALTGLSSEATAEEKISRIWRNTFKYCIENPQAMLFLEQYHNSPFQTAEINKAFEPYYAPIETIFQSAINSGEIKNISFEMFSAFNYDIIVALAKRHISGALVMDEENLEQAIRACWDAIKAS